MQTYGFAIARRDAPLLRERIVGVMAFYLIENKNIFLEEA